MSCLLHGKNAKQSGRAARNNRLLHSGVGTCFNIEFYRLVGWLVACLLACLVAWLLGCLVAWLVGSSTQHNTGTNNHEAMIRIGTNNHQSVNEPNNGSLTWNKHPNEPNNDWGLLRQQWTSSTNAMYYHSFRLQQNSNYRMATTERSSQIRTWWWIQQMGTPTPSVKTIDNKWLSAQGGVLRFNMPQYHHLNMHM